MGSHNNPNMSKLTSVETEKPKEEAVCSSEKLQDFDSSIQEGMVRVCLASDAEAIDCSGSNENGTLQHVKQEANNLEVLSDGVKSFNENEVEIDAEKGEDNSDLEDSEEDESSSSSSSSSDDEDEDDEEESDDDEDDEVEMEEGEVREEIVAWSDDEEDHVVKGPIRSKNEVQDLPPVPAVTVTLEPHHQTLPIGVILSIMGTQVVVEGVENHNPLNEGSILWITESRTPLGVVDEIFGPVKNPYYIIRYNSDTEIPTGIQQGSLISFVPEFADYVLNSNNNLYKKGYDASNEHDEELSEELEFSDDEKEAEYKRMMKMSKRGSNEKNTKKGKKSRNRGGKCKNDHQSLVNSTVNNSSSGEPTSGPHAPNFTPCGVWPNGLQSVQPQGNGLLSNGFPPNGFPYIQPQSNGFPPNGYPSIQPQSNGFPSNGFLPNGFTGNMQQLMQLSFIQQPVQNLGMPSLPAFNPQFNTGMGQMFPYNFGPPNSGALAFWPQNNCNQSQVWPPMGLQPGVASMNNDNNNGAARPCFIGAGNGNDNGESSPNPNQGRRKPFQKGGGRYRGGKSERKS